MIIENILEHFKSKYFLILIVTGIFFADCSFLSAQPFSSRVGFEERIAFEYINNFIIVKLILDGKLPLNFILDTGAQHTMITKKEIAKILNLKFKREFRVMGADMKRELVAYLVNRVDIKLENIKRENTSMLVLDEDYYLFEEMTGMPIHGILGAGFFRRYILEINYMRKFIRIKDPAKFYPTINKLEAIDLKLNSGKPYIKSETIVEQGGETKELTYLIDSGAGVSMLINPSSDDEISMPENIIPGNVGNGLGGSMEGFIGRTSMLKIGSHLFQNIPTHYHQLELDSLVFSDDRNGLIGNLILERFNVIIDFPGEKLYLRPNKNLSKDFKFDKSGLSVMMAGSHFNQMIIQNVIKNSPAALAGIEKGDKVLSINYLPTWLLSLDYILNRLKKKEGTKIRLRLKGKNGKKTVVFYLKDLI